MRLSTSSSEASKGRIQQARPIWRSVVGLVGSLLLILLLAECGTRTFVYDMSATLRRIQMERAVVSSLRGSREQAGKILIVGNSLLLTNVDMDLLNLALEPSWYASRFAIEQTTYYDWYFGLRGLLRMGARPDAVAVVFEPRHLMGQGVRGEMFGHFLLNLRDLPEATRTLGLSPSQASELLIANVSAFYGLRVEIRKNLLGRLIPGLADLAALFAGSPQRAPDTEALRRIGRERIERLRDVVVQGGSSLVLVLAPPVSLEQELVLTAIGKDLGVDVIAPLTTGELFDGDFSADGYHLGVEGRKRFTRALERETRTALRRVVR